MAEPALPEPGDTVVEKYKLVRILGHGGMGVVFEARDLRLGRRVAIKMLAPGAWQTPEGVVRFEREARAAARLQSRHAVRLLDVDVAPPGLPFMVMELLEGRDLDAELAARGPLPVAEAVGYVWQACQAMAEAHAAGIVHRDLKPSNLFLCVEGGRRVLKVLDFGISKLTDERNRALTQTGSTFGTPEYMSPEQVRALRSVDGRSDIWSLGIVLYELLTGTTPFRGDAATAVVAAIVADPARPVRELRPGVPRELEAVVEGALRRRAADRYPSAQAFAQALAPFVAPGAGGESTSAGVVAAVGAPTTGPARRGGAAAGGGTLGRRVGGGRGRRRARPRAGRPEPPGRRGAAGPGVGAGRAGPGRARRGRRVDGEPRGRRRPARPRSRRPARRPHPRLDGGRARKGSAARGSPLR